MAAVTISTFCLVGRHAFNESVPLSYIVIQNIKMHKIALTYISCVYHRNAAFVGGRGASCHYGEGAILLDLVSW